MAAMITILSCTYNYTIRAGLITSGERDQIVHCAEASEAGLVTRNGFSNSSFVSPFRRFFGATRSLSYAGALLYRRLVYTSRLAYLIFRVQQKCPQL